MSNFFEYKFMFFLSGSILLLTSILFHVKGKEKLSLIFLMFASLFLFLFAAFLFSFHNIWDERFHALVAKNTMHHPLMPTLYNDPVVNIQYNWWDKAHIWLHKQPLFLWQISLSYKIFGVNEFATRIPSVLLGCLMVFAGYRSGKIVGNKDIGYYTALLIITSTYLIELISGYGMLDHNDVSFMAYITLSIWAWIEYSSSKKFKWIILIGIFSGFAILCKWLVGLLIYLIWGIYSIMENKLSIKKYYDILLAFLITIMIALPWQLYIFYNYPIEASIASEYNLSHYTISHEGHEGPFSYHFSKMAILFGSLVPFLIIPSIFLFYKKISNKKIFWALNIGVVFVYLFFSLAATKMPSFTIIVALPIYISLAHLIDYMIGLVKRVGLPKPLFGLLVFLFCFTLAYCRIDFHSFRQKHGFLGQHNQHDLILIENAKIFKNLNLPKNAVIFNIKGLHHIEAMFYTGLPAYNFIPTETQYEDLKQKDRITAIFQTKDDRLPSYLLSDPNVIIIKKEIKRCD